jgi:hypothetical protein
MRTWSLHSRQLCLQSAARTPLCDHNKRNAERSIGNLNIKLEAKLKIKYNTKSVANSKHKCAPVLCIHVSFSCNQQLTHCRVTIMGSAMQSGVLDTRTKD